MPHEASVISLNYLSSLYADMSKYIYMTTQFDNYIYIKHLKKNKTHYIYLILLLQSLGKSCIRAPWALHASENKYYISHSSNQIPGAFRTYVSSSPPCRRTHSSLPPVGRWASSSFCRSGGTHRGDLFPELHIRTCSSR